MSTDQDDPGGINPPWSQDELIVVLDFYLQHSPSIPSKTSNEIIELSALLNRLREHVGGRGDEKFRNPNGVYMKLMNFRRFDPDYEGSDLQRGGKEDEVIWNLYASMPEELSKVSKSIRSFVDLENIGPIREPTNDDEEEGEEGGLLTRVHRIRETNPWIVERKKESILKRLGALACEACGFDFSEAYGVYGEGFIECHHTKPISEMMPGDRTRLKDLALVCSNCHRMLHRRRPWLTIDQLSKLVQSR
jgi:5-methylcytosine-specific restriction protein A